MRSYFGLCLISASKHPIMPKYIQVWRAVDPLVVTASISVPNSIKSGIQSVPPVYAAVCSGVLPLISRELGSAPASRSRRAQSGQSFGLLPIFF